MYFTRNREFGSALSNFGIPGGGGDLNLPNHPLGTPLTTSKGKCVEIILNAHIGKEFRSYYMKIIIMYVDRKVHDAK
jgi:hypothetical protein